MWCVMLTDIQYQDIGKFYFLFIEPTGQTGPKVSGDGLNKQNGHSGSDIALLCEAQAFPAPRKR